MNTTTERLLRACSAWSRIDTPLGGMLLARSTHGLAGAWFDGQKHHPGALPPALQASHGDDLLERAAAQLQGLLRGEPASGHVPLDPQGSEFQRAVWAALLHISAGATTSYGELAAALGAPKAVRAVGAAVGRNPVSVLVPCHRVVGRDGSLTGYAGGLVRKQALLALEQPGRKTLRHAA